jgi:lipopolysaccharide heptosyltransferase II
LKILLVRLRQIGDVVFTTPAIRALRDRFPDAQISYVVEPAAAPVVERNTSLTQVIVAPRLRGLAGLRRDVALGRLLRDDRYDIAIDFHGGPRASLLTWLSRAPIRIGYDVPGRRWMYTRVVGRPRQLRARHSVENQWDLLESLGIPRANADAYPVEMASSPELARAVAFRLESAGVTATDSLVVIHVSAGNPFRRWPMQSFSEVAAALVGRHRAVRVIVTSGPSEREAANQVITSARDKVAANDRPRVLDCGDFSLPELRELADRAALYIGGDSGPMHIAATSHVPMVSLYGPTLPARSAPWRSAAWRSAAIEVHGLECRPCDQRVCTPGDFRCLLRIEPREVIEMAERLVNLEARSNHSGNQGISGPRI